MARNLEAKHEKILKALLRLPENRKCAVCDTLGPQYVVVDFSTFVCTICCGLHRQFSHRCKGISMATFKPEEVRALEEGGNGVALAKYLAKWNPRDAPKPTDRSPTKVRDWIDLVFVKKRFYNAEAAYAPTVSRTQSVGSARSTASRESDFGFRAAASKVAGNGAVAGQAAGGHVDAGRATSEAGSLIDLDLGQASSSHAHPPGHLLNSGAVPAGPVHTPAELPFASGGSNWSSFADGPGSAPAVDGQGSGWAAFDAPADSQPSAAAPAAAAAAAAPPALPVQQPGFEGWQAFDGGAASAPAPAGSPVQQPPAPGSRGGLVMKELPSDLFSEPLAPPRVPPATALPYLAGAQGQQPLHPGYPPPGLVAYPIAPSAAGLPQGYLPMEHPQYLVTPGQQQLPQQPPLGVQQPPAAGSGAADAGGLGAPENDVFSGLVPGLRSSLPPVLPSSVPQQQQQQQQPAQFGQYAPYGAVQHPAYANSNAQQSPLAAAHYGAAQSAAGFGGLGSGQQAGTGTAFQAVQPKKGGNPFA